MCALGLDHQVKSSRFREVEGQVFLLPVEDGVLGALVYSVRLHLDPSVQAAGEHHPTDLQTSHSYSHSADDQ